MISIDSGFFVPPGLEDSEGVVVVVCDRRSKCKVPEKGVGHSWAATAVLKDFDQRKKSDEEMSRKASAQAVKNLWTGDIFLANSSAGDSHGNREVERAVQSLHGLARISEGALENCN